MYKFYVQNSDDFIFLIKFLLKKQKKTLENIYKINLFI